MGRPKREATFEADGYVLQGGFRIRRRPLQEGGHSYVVELGYDSDGKRLRKQCPTLTAARNHADRQSIERERIGLAAVALSDRDREDAIRALRLLRGMKGATLTAAAEAYAKKHAPPEPGITLRELAAKFTEWMATTPQKLNARSPGQYRKATVKDAKAKLARLCRDLGDTVAAAVTADDLRAWLDAQGFHPIPWDNHRRVVGMAYTWATREGGPLQGAANPAAGMKPPALARGMPAIYTPERTTEVLRYVERERPDLVPYFACGFFGGLRPDELRRILPDALDFDAGEITVPAEASKTHRPRLVTIPANLRAWLEKYPPVEGRPLGLSHAALARFRREIREALGIDWPKDVARHCFATYHCALYGMDKTAEELGHGSTKMLHDHYKGMASRREAAAARYFDIKPATQEEAQQWQLLKPA